MTPPTDSPALVRPLARSTRLHARPVRRWPRRVLIGTNMIVAVMLLAAGSVYGYVNWRLGQIKKISIPSIAGGKKGAGADPPGSPMTILVVGSDTRSGLSPQDSAQFGSRAAVGGQRSDTIILLRVDPKSTQASLLSIPRDLWVQIPGHTYSQRINTTFDTGPDLLVQAVQQDLGIPIDHYIEVNFDTFRQVVNSVGGVKEYFPTPARDAFSLLNIKSAGCYNLSGDQALAFVRSRHYEYYADGRWHFEAESDLARIRRQQSFIKKMLSKAQSTGLTNPLKLNGVVAGVTTNLTVDKGFSQSLILSLAKRFRSLSPSAIASSTLPNNPAVIQGNDVLLLKQPDATQAIDQFLGRSTTPAASTSTIPAGVVPSQVRIQVLNGTGRPGQASQAETALRAAGFVVTSIGTAQSLNNPTTLVRYGAGADGKAALVASVIIGGGQLQADPTVNAGEVVVVTGASYGGIQTPSQTPSQTPAASATTAPPSTPATTAAPAAPPTTAFELPGTPPGFVAPPC
jgi:LCP family protein required for cell wall assembly